MQSNVLLELQGRLWRQVEDWNVRRLGQFAEERALLGLRESWCCRSVVKNKQSTLALAFSCDGSLLASSHLTHEILIHKTRPCLLPLRVLSAHPSTNRSPWCLTFHPSRPHHLLSGCLGGSVLLWDVQSGKCLCVWQSGISSPINSLVFLPTSPDHFLVACDTRLRLLHHCGDHMETVWSAKTATLDVKVRLVLHHPESRRILTAVTNVTQSYESTMTNFMRIPPQRSSYRLQMYPCGFDRGPDLENSSMGLISMAVRVLSPQSVVLTSQLVISSSMETSGTKLSIHSIRRGSFGQCLFSTLLTPKHMGVVSLDLSVCQRFLLLASSGKQFLYHMESHHSSLKVFQVEERRSSLNLELCCEMRGVYSANVARWMPRQSGRVGGVCVGTQQGGVVWWGGGEGGRWRRGAGTDDISNNCRLDWFDKK